MELKGKNAIVTGAARGIGRGIALKLADAGANVALVDLGRPKDPALTYNLAAHSELASAVDEVKYRGVKAVAILGRRHAPGGLRADGRRDREGLGLDRHPGEQCRHYRGRPGGGVFRGGVGPRDGGQRQGAVLCSKAAIPHLLRNKEGAIVNIASIAGKTSRGGLSAYCASKFAVMALTQALAEELGPANIRVNAVCPGLLRTAMWTDVLDKYLSKAWGGNAESLFDDTVGSMCYLRREQTPADIGEAVVYLARADNVTGTSVVVAGGAESTRSGVQAHRKRRHATVRPNPVLPGRSRCISRLNFLMPRSGSPTSTRAAHFMRTCSASSCSRAPISVSRACGTASAADRSI